MEKSTGSGLEGAREKERGQSLGKTGPGDLVGRGEEIPDRDKGGNPEAQAGPELTGPGEKNREAPVLVSPESGPAPSGAAASGTGCGPLRHTSSARPRSAFLSAPVFSRKPRSLCRKPARHSTRRGRRAAMPQSHRKRAFPGRKWNLGGAGPGRATPRGRGLGEGGASETKRWGVAVNTCDPRRLRERAVRSSALRSGSPHRPGLGTGLLTPAAPEVAHKSRSHYCDLHPANLHFPGRPQGGGRGSRRWGVSLSQLRPR